MSYIIPSASASLVDRFTAAWYAFKMKVKPDVQAVFDHIESLEKAKQELAAKRQVSLDKLEGFNKSCVTSIAAGTTGAEDLLRQVMPAIEELDPTDQLVIIKHIIKNNPRIGRSLAMAPWIRNHINDIFDNLPE